jgi:hypothetical protein
LLRKHFLALTLRSLKQWARTVRSLRETRERKVLGLCLHWLHTDARRQRMLRQILQVRGQKRARNAM